MKVGDTGLLNAISMSKRFALSLISLAIYAIWAMAFTHPLYAPGETLVGNIILVISILLIVYLTLVLARIAKPMFSPNPIVAILYSASLWMSTFSLGWNLQLLPGDYGDFQLNWYTDTEWLLGFSGLLYAIGAGLTLIALLAPANEKNWGSIQVPAPKWLAGITNVVLRSRRKLQLSVMGILVAMIISVPSYVAAESYFASNAIAEVNSCIQKNFDARWRTLYLADPMLLSREWEYPAVAERPGWERYSISLTQTQSGEMEIWLRKVPEPYIGPENWKDFVNEVSVVGIPILVRRNGIERMTTLAPIELNESLFVEFGSFYWVSGLKDICLEAFRPTFPITRQKLWGAGTLIDSVTKIPGYVRAKGTQAP